MKIYQTHQRSKQILKTTAIMSIIALTSTLQAKDVSSGTSTYDTASEIINGTTSSTDTYPWMGFIADEANGQYCGASLISSTWVLTAAHCFNNEEGTASDLATGALASVYFGSDTNTSQLESDAQVSAIARIIIHPSYDPNEATSANVNDYDIALIELSSAITLTPVALLAPGVETPADVDTLIMGWGTTELDEEGESINSSVFLLEARQVTVDRATCNSIYGGGITENMICAGATTDVNSDTCQGDSGGPLLAEVAENDWIQIGVVSFGGTENGPNCADPDAPGVYSNIGSLTGFIQEYVSDAVFKNPETETNSGELGAPTLTITVTGNAAQVNWSAVVGADGYILYYAPIFGIPGPSGSVDLGSLTNLPLEELPFGLALYVAIQPYKDGVLGKKFSNVELLLIEFP
jgi:secreted trypsin-like serine protease